MKLSFSTIFTALLAGLTRGNTQTGSDLPNSRLNFKQQGYKPIYDPDKKYYPINKTKVTLEENNFQNNQNEQPSFSYATAVATTIFVGSCIFICDKKFLSTFSSNFQKYVKFSDQETLLEQELKEHENKELENRPFELYQLMAATKVNLGKIKEAEEYFLGCIKIAENFCRINKKNKDPEIKSQIEDFRKIIDLSSFLAVCSLLREVKGEVPDDKTQLIEDLRKKSKELLKAKVDLNDDKFNKTFEDFITTNPVNINNHKYILKIEDTLRNTSR